MAKRLNGRTGRMTDEQGMAESKRAYPLFRPKEGWVGTEISSGRNRWWQSKADFCQQSAEIPEVGVGRGRFAEWQPPMGAMRGRSGSTPSWGRGSAVRHQSGRGQRQAGYCAHRLSISANSTHRQVRDCRTYRVPPSFPHLHPCCVCACVCVYTRTYAYDCPAMK